MIDQQTLLEYLNISNVWDIIERVKFNKQEQYKEEMMKQKAAHATWGSWPEDSADLADKENMGLASWQDVPMTPQALWTPEHTELHMAFINENKDAYQQRQQAFDAHISAEEIYTKWQQIVPNGQVAPQAPQASQATQPINQNAGI
jgi:hypothetical protein